MKFLLTTLILLHIIFAPIEAEGKGFYSNIFPEQFEVSLIDSPVLSVITETEVGESIISRELKGKKPAIQLDQELKGYSVRIAFFKYKITFFSKVLTLYSKTKDGTFYVDENSFVENTNAGTLGGIFIPNDNKSPIEICYIFAGSANCDPLPSLAEGSGFKYIEVDFFIKTSFKRELIFVGGNSKVINLLYREYKDDIARPAFSQDLKFDITEDDVIGFKGARFQVIKAGNTGITYKVLRHLN